jgi:hypothetical protein
MRCDFLLDLLLAIRAAQPRHIAAPARGKGPAQLLAMSTTLNASVAQLQQSLTVKP